MTDETGQDAGFSGLGLREELLAALASLGYEEPTPIQREAIPVLLAGSDVLGQAATGTGKTAAFALPILQRLEPGERGIHPSALVLVPTRELAMQVSEAMHRYGRGLDARVLPVYGGAPIGRQLRELSRGVDVVVATPGRAVDHLRRETLSLDAVRTVVLDEADEMLDMGFAEDLDAILEATPGDRQTVLFSATLPPRIDAIAARHQRDPVRVEIARAAPAEGGGRVEQRVYVVDRAHKPATLARILDVETPAAALVFCRTREEVDRLTESLNGRGYRAEALHGGMGQEARDRVMGRLRAGTADLLVATDVAARGLDVEHLSHVVNYDVPSSPEVYTHRIGRVGRAGREGVAITLAEPREHRMLATIERVTRQRVAREKVPSVADLRARRLELTRAALEDAVQDDDIDVFRGVVDALLADHDLLDVTLAAVKLAHSQLGGGADEEEIPLPAAADRRERHATGGDERGTRPDASSTGRRAPRAGTGHLAGGSRVIERARPAGGRAGSIYVGLGRSAGVRPGDLVGAIANEAGLRGPEIGAVQIREGFSLVEVPEDRVDEVIAALRRSTLRGRRPQVRRDREG